MLDSNVLNIYCGFLVDVASHSGCLSAVWPTSLIWLLGPNAEEC